MKEATLGRENFKEKRAANKKHYGPQNI